MSQIDISGLTVRKVDALAALVQRAPITEAEAIFASEFLSYIRSVAKKQDELRAQGVPSSEASVDHTPSTNGAVIG